MTIFTIETTYHLPVYRQRTYEADSLEAACELALADQGWDDEKSDVETSGDTYVSGAWEGRDVAYNGHALPVPTRFSEHVQRKAEHFAVLLGLLRVFAHPPRGGLHDAAAWRQRADAVLAKAEAILTRDSDPEAEGGVA